MNYLSLRFLVNFLELKWSRLRAPQAFKPSEGMAKLTLVHCWNAELLECRQREDLIASILAISLIKISAEQLDQMKATRKLAAHLR